jgi:type I restriction enzyme S subunit
MMENRFQVLPLEGLVNFKTGKLNSNAAKPDGMFPFFTCSQETFRTDTWSFDGEYVLLAGNNAAGIYPLKYFNGKFDAYQRTYAINAIDENVLVTRYVYYALRLQLELMKSISTGVATKFLTLSLLNRTQIPIPPLATQKKIAAILSAYDDLIENNLWRIKILEEMAQNLYREWFVKFRFPGYQHARFTDSPLGRIPEGWEVKTLGDCCELVMGQSPKSEFYNEIGEGLPFHQGVTNFGNRFPTDRVYCTSTERMAEEGDILFSVRAPVGRINIALHRLVIGRGVAAIRDRDRHQFFLLHQLKEVFCNEDSMGNGAIFKAVTKSDLTGVKLVKPASPILAEFDGMAHSIGLQIETLTAKNTTLRRTRDLVLPRLISGEVDVSELDIAVPEEAVT